MHKPMLIFSGVVGVLVGLGFVMPAIAQLRDLGTLPALGVGLFLLGLVLTACGGGAVFYGARGRRT